MEPAPAGALTRLAPGQKALTGDAGRLRSVTEGQPGAYAREGRGLDLGAELEGPAHAQRCPGRLLPSTMASVTAAVSLPGLPAIGHSFLSILSSSCRPGGVRKGQDGNGEEWTGKERGAAVSRGCAWKSAERLDWSHLATGFKSLFPLHQAPEDSGLSCFLGSIRVLWHPLRAVCDHFPLDLGCDAG